MTHSTILATDWKSMQEQAAVLVRSGLLPRTVDTPEKAIVIMMQGRELGIGPMQALAGINVIAGKATVSPQLMLALIYNSGQLDDMEVDSQVNYCTVTMKRVGQQPHSETFTIDNAKAMGLAGKDNWHKQPAVMLKWRAVSACARVVFPDVIMGLYTTEEIDPDVMVEAETGEIVEQIETMGQHSSTGRPMAPEALRDYITKSINGSSKELCAADEAALLGKEWGIRLSDIPGNKRHAIVSYMIGREIDTFKALTVAEIDMIARWIEDVQSAHAEAQAIIDLLSSQFAPGA